ncbi:MMPL family transporter [Actinocorallia longicatena]|uniref:MMPL family transporter n=1 Tax=Actinocorallia longicatena TaxID=111803 RepID=A0ABP6QJR0_9ACTN
MIRTISGFSARRPVAVILLWVALLGAGFGIGTGVFGDLVPDTGTVHGSESARLEQRLDETVSTPDTLTAVLPGAVPAGLLDRVKAVPGVAGVSEPLPSALGPAVLVEVALADGDAGEDAAEPAAELLGSAGAKVSGGPLQDEEFDAQAQKDVARAEMLSMPVVLILLVIVFGGLIAAGLPLLVAVAGSAGTFGVLFAFSRFQEVSVYAVQITTMLAVGLAVDYGLLMVNRFREERRTRPDVQEAIAAMSATAGRTVLFSGLTVAVALTGLVVFPDTFLRSMGLASAAVVLVDMLAALTLLPAVLALVGRRISAAGEPAGDGLFGRVARGVQRRPLVTLIGTAAVLAVLAAPAFGLRMSEGDPRMLPESTQTRQMWDALDRSFPGRTGPDPLEVVADASAGDPALERLRTAIAALPGVISTRTESLTPDLTVIHTESGIPPQDPASGDLVRSIRALDAPFPVGVTGGTARLADYRTMLADRLPWAMALVLGGTLVLLFAFTGSVVLPVKAVLTNLLSLGAALGCVVWVFQHGHLAGLVGADGLGYVHLTVPVLVGAIAFGLSMDYEVFLLSRIRERWLADGDPDASVAEGLQRAGGIVTAAALVIGVVFAGFVFGGFAPIKAVGLGLVLVILLDATLVRMLLVPATMTLLGRRNWWLPRPLAVLYGRVSLSEAPPVKDPVEASR